MGHEREYDRQPERTSWHCPAGLAPLRRRADRAAAARLATLGHVSREVADLADRDPDLRSLAREHRRRDAGNPSARYLLAADAGLWPRGRARRHARAGDGLLPAALQPVRAAGRDAAANPRSRLSADPGPVRRHRPRDESGADPGGLAVSDPAEHL